MIIKNYNSIKNKIRSGDLIAFNGRGIISNAIKLFTNSQYSHVGMAIWAKLTDEDETPKLYIAESTTLSNVPDFTGELRKGMQIVPLDDRIKWYDGKAWWVPLETPLSEKERYIVIKKLVYFHDKKVQYDTTSAIRTGLDFSICGKKIFHISNDRSRLFCSEVMADILKEIKRIPSNAYIAEYYPKDIVNLKCYKDPIPLF